MTSVIVGLVAVSIIWAGWHLTYEWMRRSKAMPESPIEPHCCACSQFEMKCDAMRGGVTFYAEEKK